MSFSLGKAHPGGTRDCVYPGIYSNKLLLLIVLRITKLEVINCNPVTPIFLPKRPEAIDSSNGKVIIAKYIL